MRIFITGATGYIGRALAARLAAEGHELRALIRDERRTAPLTELGVTLFRGDVGDRASMREGMSGADWVIHAAADLDHTGPSGRMEQVNVAGSENVASLAFKLGVPRLLSISSVAAFGGSPDDGSPATERSAPLRPFPTEYSRTKFEGQQAIRAWAERGVGVVTVYPSLVYGPPGKKEGANALLRQLYLGRFPALVEADRFSSWVLLDDVVDGIARAMTRAASGADYLLAGEAITVRELARRVALLGGAKAPRLELSVGTARLLVRLALPFYRLRGRRAPMPLFQIASLARHWRFDDAKARRELDWNPRGLDAGLPLTVDYLQSQERSPAG
jgi:nucleoside-diphosphate-sugar epimerase